MDITAYITGKIKPSIEKAKLIQTDKDTNLTENTCLLNMQNSVNKILEKSSSVCEQISNEKLGIVSAYYNTTTGKVRFDNLIASEENLTETLHGNE